LPSISPCQPIGSRILSTPAASRRQAPSDRAPARRKRAAPRWLAGLGGCMATPRTSGGARSSR
jgi:hypothetical protein